MATLPETPEIDPLPEGLADMEPGASLGTILGSIDRSRLNGQDRVIVLQAWSRQLAHAQAELYASMTAVIDAEADLYQGRDAFSVHDAASSEVRAALTLTRRGADFHLALAQQLIDNAELWDALHHGRIDLPKARVVIDHTCHLDGDEAARVTTVALDRAHRQTTGQLRARLRQLVIEVDPESARRRYEQRIADRRITSEATEAGTANVFGLDLPAADSSSALRKINRLARRLKKAGDPRTMDQIRADVFLDLLNGRHENQSVGQRGVVDIRVDLTTLMELDERSGELPGWGPVIADVARKVVSEQDDAEWRFSVIDPVNGQVMHSGTTGRRPTAAQKRRVESRYQTCAFPGCRMPAGECDIDHKCAWVDGGPTEDFNLEPLCRRDHRLKHNGWSVEMLIGGVFLWTSPLGLTYLVETQPP